jgi:hypothetical protein
VPSSVITCTDDRSRDFTRLVVAPRLGVEPIELPGGHSPFLSRPAALADVLAGLADAGGSTPVVDAASTGLVQ